MHTHCTDSDFLFSGILAIVSAIGHRLGSPEIIDDNEIETAIEAVGQIGSCKNTVNFVWFILA